MIGYSLRTLEKEGVTTTLPQGAIVTDRVNEILGTLGSKMDEMATTVQDLKKKLK